MKRESFGIESEMLDMDLLYFNGNYKFTIRFWKEEYIHISALVHFFTFLFITEERE